jgi:O-antigen ligase
VLVLLVAVAALLAAGAVGLVPALDPYSGPLIARRLASFADLARDGNLWVRGEVLRQALVTWQAHPWIGWGVGAYGDMYQYPNQAIPAWVPNLFVHHLFDSGALGLTGLVLGVGLTAGRGVRAWTRARDTGLPGAECVAPLLLALLGLLVAFQTTEASWLAYPWIYLGLLEGAVWEDGMRRRRSDLTDAHAPGHAAGLAAHE